MGTTRASTHTGRRPDAGAVALALAAMALAHAAPVHAAWSTHGGDAQHTARSTVPTQPLQQIHWQTPVDLDPQYTGEVLYIHYGSPLVTEGNTVIVPVKVGADGPFRVEARRGADGTLLWQLDTDWEPPPSFWTPILGPTLAHGGRLYFPGAGGTVFWTDALDTPGPHTATRVAFYGDAAYAADPGTFNGSLHVCTPLTSDSRGTVFFGVRAVAGNPLGIASSVAAVDAAGSGRFVSMAAASGGLCTQVATNCAPALSGDEQTLYVAGLGEDIYSDSYLVALGTPQLGTRHVRALVDPVTQTPAYIFDTGTSTPMVAPDGKVYYGALDAGVNAGRGWLFQFDAALAPAGAPGAFGWDHTPSLVPASAVAGYAGASSYLLMSKYNFYAGLGDGTNKLAILDPLATQVDGFSGATVMKEVHTVLCPTPDPDWGPQYPNAVKEWCINTAVVDPFKHSVLAGAEDGKLYRWNLDTNALSEVITLTPGLGEAYTPTVAGPDGQVYAINNATLFAVGATNTGVPPPPGATARLQLSAPQPNPFARSTTLHFQLANETAITLEVLDLTGRRVAVLAQGRFPAGDHVASWDGRDGVLGSTASGTRRAAGVYFVRLSDDRGATSRKVFFAR